MMGWLRKDRRAAANTPFPRAARAGRMAGSPPSRPLSSRTHDRRIPREKQFPTGVVIVAAVLGTVGLLGCFAVVMLLTSPPSPRVEGENWDEEDVAAYLKKKGVITSYEWGPGAYGTKQLTGSIENEGKKY